MVKPLEVVDLMGLVDLRSLGALVRYSPKGHDLLPSYCDLVWGLIEFVSFDVEVIECTRS